MQDNNARDDDSWMNSRQVRDFFGGVSVMWIPRRTKSDGFPEPDAKIADRNYWRFGKVREWRDAQIVKKYTKKDSALPGRKTST